VPPQVIPHRYDKVRPVSRANPVSTTRKHDDDSNGLFAEGFGHGLIPAARSSSTDNHDVSPLSKSTYVDALQEVAKIRSTTADQGSRLEPRPMCVCCSLQKIKAAGTVRTAL
jgi:hypothetical protein